MFNLLRMDLYRLKRSKSVYMGLAGMMVMVGFCYWFLWLLVTSGGRDLALKMEMDAALDSGVLDGYTSIMMFRDTGMDGGMYCSVLGIMVAIFVCGDFQNGFIKNIMALHRDRWKYVVSKMISGGILTFCYMAVQLVFCLILNRLALGELNIPYTSLSDSLFYLAQAWLLTTAFSTLMIMLCVTTRSMAAGVLLALVLGSGMLVVALSALSGLFHADGWSLYTLYFNLTNAPSSFTGLGDLRGFAVGAIFLVVYGVLGAAAIRMRDI
ncbi:MAG: ABC transporter permease subunit [Lachnospiraceae bacterium]|jgi:ABC-2 type transport system permease protein|nr:ABC transporter permease subunit [Lachnospiraceae bacterium]MCI8997096.1 ABC transporter permease subunit [Lachnospiraceae bacterium]